MNKETLFEHEYYDLKVPLPDTNLEKMFQYKKKLPKQVMMTTMYVSIKH